MNFVIIEKARSHKYIRREGLPGKYEYFYQDQGGASKRQEIELAPLGTPGIDKYREEARKRLIEWREIPADPLIKETSRKYSDDQILWEGYKWRHWAHKSRSAWDWAMWEEVQRFAQEKGFKYKEKLTKQDVLNNPMIPDVENLLGGYSSIIDEETTGWRNNPRPSRMLRFISSEPGKQWSVESKREIWGYIKMMSDEDAEKTFPGLLELKKANSWDEALSTDVEIYRGIDTEGKEKIESYAGRKFLSYTIVPAIADKFARGYYHSYDAGEGKGIVVKRKVKFGDIIGFVNNDGENEVLVKLPKSTEHIQLVGPERATYERRDKSK